MKEKSSLLFDERLYLREVYLNCGQFFLNSGYMDSFHIKEDLFYMDEIHQNSIFLLVENVLGKKPWQRAFVKKSMFPLHQTVCLDVDRLCQIFVEKSKLFFNRMIYQYTKEGVEPVLGGVYYSQYGLIYFHISEKLKKSSFFSILDIEKHHELLETELLTALGYQDINFISSFSEDVLDPILKIFSHSPFILLDPKKTTLLSQKFLDISYRVEKIISQLKILWNEDSIRNHEIYKAYENLALEIKNLISVLEKEDWSAFECAPKESFDGCFSFMDVMKQGYSFEESLDAISSITFYCKNHQISSQDMLPEEWKSVHPALYETVKTKNLSSIKTKAMTLLDFLSKHLYLVLILQLFSCGVKKNPISEIINERPHKLNSLQNAQFQGAKKNISRHNRRLGEEYFF